MAYGWEGSKVRLVPLDKGKHLDNAVAWLNDPEVTAWLLIGDFPLSRLAEEEWFERAAKGGDSEVNFAIETLEGEHIGFAGLHSISYRHGTATSGTVIGRKEIWGKGYGPDAMRVRAHYAFHVLGLRMLLTEALADNTRSVRALEKAGYREIGRCPKRWWKRGAFRDALMLVLMREEWEAQQPR
jgi:RimJ/RimL family protein N-acetyltransferase